MKNWPEKQLKAIQIYEFFGGRDFGQFSPSIGYKGFPYEVIILKRKIIVSKKLTFICNISCKHWG